MAADLMGSERGRRHFSSLTINPSLRGLLRRSWRLSGSGDSRLCVQVLW